MGDTLHALGAALGFIVFVALLFFFLWRHDDPERLRRKRAKKEAKRLRARVALSSSWAPRADPNDGNYLVTQMMVMDSSSTSSSCDSGGYSGGGDCGGGD